MGKAYRITIEPSTSTFQRLDFFNVISQVRDFLKILQGNNSHLSWAITFASVNSPFKLDCEPYDTNSGDTDYEAVESQALLVSRLYDEMLSGKPWGTDVPDLIVEKTRDILKRNMNGIANTKYEFANSNTPVELSRDIAERCLSVLTPPDTSIFAPLIGKLARTELGAIEGRIVEIGTHYNKAAVRIKDRVFGNDVWCQVAESVLGELETEIRARHAWNPERIRVSGEIVYDREGNISRVQEGNIEFVETKHVPVEQLYDPDFAEGMPILEYLDKLREDDHE